MKRTLCYVKVCSAESLDNDTFKYFRGIHELDISSVFRGALFDNGAFINVRGIHTLTLRYCAHISDPAFVNFRGIHTLHVMGSVNISDAALENLRGIHTLTGCHGYTSAGLVNLRGIHTLDIPDLNVTDSDLENLRGINALRFSSEGCTNKGLENLRDIEFLHTTDCPRNVGEAFVNFRGIKALTIWNLQEDSICDSDFESLIELTQLDLHCAVGIRFPRITGQAFKHLRRLQSLDLSVLTVNDTVMSLVPRGIEVVHFTEGQITWKSLDRFEGNRVIVLPSVTLDIPIEQLQHVQQCLRHVENLIVRSVTGEGADELIAHLKGRGCRVSME